MMWHGTVKRFTIRTARLAKANIIRTSANPTRSKSSCKRKTCWKPRRRSQVGRCLTLITIRLCGRKMMRYARRMTCVRRMLFAHEVIITVGTAGNAMARRR